MHLHTSNSWSPSQEMAPPSTQLFSSKPGVILDSSPSPCLTAPLTAGLSQLSASAPTEPCWLSGSAAQHWPWAALCRRWRRQHPHPQRVQALIAEATQPHTPCDRGPISNGIGSERCIQKKPRQTVGARERGPWLGLVMNKQC